MSAWPVVGPIVVACLALTGVIFTAKSGRAAGEVDGWDRLSQRHEHEIARLDERLSIVERRLNQERSTTRWLMERVDQLVQFIRALGQEPPEPDTPCPTREMS